MKISIKSAIFSNNIPHNFFNYVEPPKKMSLNCDWYIKGTKKLRCSVYLVNRNDIFNDQGFPLRFILMSVTKKYTEDYVARDIFGENYSEASIVAVYEPIEGGIVVS